MKTIAVLSRVGVLAVILGLVVGGANLAPAQTPAADTSSPRPASPEELSPAELLKAYIQVRDQLHATQLAVINNRVEAESSARAQAAALTERLDAIKRAMEVERERQQAELQRANAERERQIQESARSTRTVLWIASALGVFGLVAVLVMPFFQMRAINRMAEVAGARPQLGTPASAALLAPAADEKVTHSNQRLLSVIDRLERRIFELEHTAAPTLPVSGTNGRAEPEPAHRPEPIVRPAPEPAPLPPPARAPAPVAEGDSRITVLLGKGRSLMTTNQPKEALACYEEILKIDDDHTEALVKKGAALERLSRDEEAIRCYDRAIEADPKMTLAYLSKGGVCNRLGRYDEALECYEMALHAEEQAK